MFTPSIAYIGKKIYQTDVLGQSVEQTHFKWLVFSHFDEPGIGKCDVAIIFHEPAMSDGIDVLAHFKIKFPGLPVLMIGNLVPQHDIVEAFRLGANDFLFLPIQPDTLLNCLHRLLPDNTEKKSDSWWHKVLPAFMHHWFTPPPSLANNGFVSSVVSSGKKTILPENVPDIQIQLLGSLGVTVHGKALPRLPGKKAKMLLAFILDKYPKFVHREVLIEQFWSDSTPESARNCLNVTLHAIRKSFEEIAPGEEIIVFHDEGYSLHPDLVIERDVDLFESYWKKGRQIEYESGMETAIDTYHQAFAFYRGDFLEDLPFEEWAERQRDKFRETWLVILDRLSVHFLEKGRHQVCMNLCRKILEKDPCLEEVHRRLMQCYVHLGMRDMAVRQFLKCKVNLREELDVTPGKATAELYQKIREW